MISSNDITQPDDSTPFTAPTELIIVATHKDNTVIQNQLKRARVADAGVVTTVIDKVADVLIRECGSSAIEAILIAINEQQRVANYSIPMITIFTDYNVGYTGKDVTFLPYLIEQLETQSDCKNAEGKLRKYKFIKTAQDKTTNEDHLFVRIVGVGNGGEKLVTLPKNAVQMTCSEALEQFYFDNLVMLKFLRDYIRVFVPRTPSSSPQAPSTPSSIPRVDTPIVTHRRLTSSTSVSSLESPQMSPSSQQSIRLSLGSAMTRSISASQSGSSPSIPRYSPSDDRRASPVAFDLSVEHCEDRVILALESMLSEARSKRRISPPRSPSSPRLMAIRPTPILIQSMDDKEETVTKNNSPR